MSVTRKMLKAMGIEDEKIDQIIEAHAEVVDALKEQRDSYKADAEKLVSVQTELDELKKEAAKNSGEDSSFKVKYDAIKEEYENFKKTVAEQETAAKVKEAYKGLLKAAGVSEKRIDAVLRVTTLDGMKLDSEGNLEGAEELTKSIKTEWADFIATEGTAGANVSKPPANNGGSTFKDMPLAEKMRYANEHPNDAEVRDWLKT